MNRIAAIPGFLLVLPWVIYWVLWSICGARGETE